MELPAPRKSYIIDYREIWPSPVARLNIETEAIFHQLIPDKRKKERTCNDPKLNTMFKF